MASLNRSLFYALVACAASALLPGLALAHNGHEHEVAIVLNPLPPALAGVVVQVDDSMAPQLLVENRSGKTLEILGRNGRAFIRFDDKGAQGNEGEQDWFDSYLPAGVQGRKPASMAHSGWKLLKPVPVWGWFDPRLKKDDGSHHWSIPVRINGVRSSISGTFHSAISHGYWQPEITAMPVLPAGVSLQLIPGQPYGFMLGNSRTQDVVVLGRQGEDFLRIGHAGVFAAQASPLWNETSAQQALRVEPGQAAAGWTRVASGSRYTWVEPRTQPAPNDTRRLPYLWQIGLRVGQDTVQVRGVSHWIARPG